MKPKFNLFASLVIFAISSLLGHITPLLGAEPAQTVSPDEAMTRLKDGNARFASAKVTQGKPVAERRAQTAQSQHPFAIIVGCADSRTSPELVFDQNVGDLFVVRTAGNLIDDHGLGSIEYAVEHLGARLIVVLGHQRCGAVKAAMDSATAPGHVNSLVHDIQPAVQAAKGKAGDTFDNTVAENAREVAARIRTEAQLGQLTKSVQIVSAVYSLDTGRVDWLKE